MSVTPEVVRHIAALARLHFDLEEAERLQQELGRMLDYFGQVAAVDTDGVEPTSHVVSLQTALRDDEVTPPGEGDRDRFLAQSAGSDAPFFRVPRFRPERG